MCLAYILIGREHLEAKGITANELAARRPPLFGESARVTRSCRMGPSGSSNDRPLQVREGEAYSFQKFQPTGAWRVWFDEAASDAERIGGVS